MDMWDPLPKGIYRSELECKLGPGNLERILVDNIRVLTIKRFKDPDSRFVTYLNSNPHHSKNTNSCTMERKLSL